MLVLLLLPAWAELMPVGGGRSGWAGVALRWTALIFLPLWWYRLFLNPDFFGGTDARWYGYAAADAVLQAREGVLPILIGQTEFQFDGTINPARLAPFYQHLAVLLDLLTGHALYPAGPGHLAIACAALLAGLVCYLCLVSLEPAARNLGCVVALLYAGTPAIAGVVYAQEMYATLMGYVWLPVVLYGNVRLIRRDDFSGWAWLGMGLTLVWTGHAPIGALATVLSIAVQGMRLSAQDFSWSAWRRALGGVVLFAALAAFYFVPIRELGGQGAGDSTWIWVGLLSALGGTALVRHVVTGSWWWLGIAAGLAAGTVGIHRLYGLWFLLAAVLLGACRLLARIWKPLAVGGVERVGLALLLAAAVLAGAGQIPVSGGLTSDWITRLFPQSLLPVQAGGRALSDIQLGYGMLGLLLLGGGLAIRRGRRDARLLLVPAAVLLILAVPVPLVTRFLCGMIPDPLLDLLTTTLWPRCLPVLAACAAFVGFLGTAGPGRPGPAWGRAAIMAAALLWSDHESEKFVRRLQQRPLNTPEEIQAFHRSEIIKRYNFNFRQQPLSGYSTDGVVDYHLESRLLPADDPGGPARETLDWSGAQVVTLATRPEETAPLWLHLEPGITLAPGERKAVRFEFFERAYAGALILRGPGGFYREYALPESGLGPRGFGIAPERGKTLALWNTTRAPLPLELYFLQAAPPADGKPFGDFARVQITSYDPEKMAVRTTGLIPYRATITTATPAFLETPRLFLPGFVATLNGKDVPVTASPNHHAMIGLHRGQNDVELRYTGTPLLRGAFYLSAACWLGLLGFGLRAAIRTRWRR